ncbi:WD40 repeat domain-containing protein [Streptomyces sp. NPDC085866]|uniref:WD40 repeat domain-containing protein n=1 Tax=Streptomyces sp. NPDC085866 TaxID=3365736 RepID=UPI0037D62696
MLTEWRGGEVDSVAALQGSEIVLLTVKGRLARVDAADSGIRTQPFLVHPAPNWAGTGLNSDLFAHVQLIARPGHPGQVAAVTMTGNQRGEILLWDVRTPRHIATLPGPAISVPSSTDSYTSALAFDTDGSHLAVQNTDGQVHVWDVDRRKQLVSSVPRGTNDTLVGIGPGDRVVTCLEAKKQVQIYDLTSGDSNTVPIEGGDWITGFVHGHRLTIDTGRLRQTFDLRPDIQFRTLCDAVGRDYTKAERKLLPKGTPSKAPCT